MTEDDSQAFRDITSGLGETSPEAKSAEEDIELRERLSQSIERLHQEQLGRPIVTRGGEQKTAGYILPLAPDNSSHLSVLADGTMFVSEPAEPHSEGHVNGYKKYFSPNESPFPSEAATLSALKDILRGANSLWKVTATNDSPDSTPQMQGVIDQALHTAVENKGAREKARRESAKYLLDGLDKTIFRKQQPPGHQAPPPESPQPPSQQ